MKKPSTQHILIGAISPASAGSLYQQIVDGIKLEVATGRLASGAELPSFRVLAGQLLVSLITVKRAYEELEREGIIYRRQGRGTYVAEQGGDLSRKAKHTRAREYFQKGIEEAMGAGLKPAEISALVRDMIKDRKAESDE